MQQTTRANRSTTRDAAFAATDELPRDHPIVTYCSVGFRSASIASWLDSRGFKNVRNLEGSLFEWANRGGKVYQGDKLVNGVHPYDEEWGKLLDRKHWKWAP